MHNSVTFVDAAERVAERQHKPGLAVDVARGGVATTYASLQYLVLHLEHCFARRSSGAAQAAQFVRIILRFA